MWDGIVILGSFVEMIFVCMSDIMVMKLLMSGVLVKVVVVLCAHLFKYGLLGYCASYSLIR